MAKRGKGHSAINEARFRKGGELLRGFLASEATTMARMTRAERSQMASVTLLLGLSIMELSSKLLMHDAVAEGATRRRPRRATK